MPTILCASLTPNPTGALPASLYFALRYESQGLERALVANANVGGDSAARGITIGILLGAVQGEDSVPQRWIRTLRSMEHVDSLLARLEAGGESKAEL
jgi:ADP-ribosylglycohydrolase